MAVINVRVPDKLKKDATQLFAGMGLDMSSAVNAFLRQCLLKNGLPFEVIGPPRSKEEDEEMKKLIMQLELSEKQIGEGKTVSLDELNSEVKARYGIDEV